MRISEESSSIGSSARVSSARGSSARVLSARGLAVRVPKEREFLKRIVGKSLVSKRIVGKRIVSKGLISKRIAGKSLLREFPKRIVGKSLERGHRKIFEKSPRSSQLLILVQSILPTNEGLTELTDWLAPLRRYLATAGSVSVIYLTEALSALIQLILLSY